MRTLDELILRWNAPMPAFFKPIFQGSLILLILCAGIVFCNQTLLSAGIIVPHWLTVATGVAGSVGALVTKLTVDWNAKRTADKVAGLRSDWYLSLMLWLSVGGAYLGYAIVAGLLIWLLYLPFSRWVYGRVTLRSSQRSNAWRVRIDRLADLNYTIRHQDGY